MCQDVIDRFSGATRIEGHEVRFGVSVGLAKQTLSETTPADLLIDADIALYEAKARGKTRIARFDADLKARTVARKRLADSISTALEQREFEPFFQTQHCPQTGAIIGAEALVRWRHPERGLLTPPDFLEVADADGRLKDIDRLTMERTIEVVQAMEAKGLNLGRVSLNVSLRRLCEPSFLQAVRSLPPLKTQVVIEIVEAVFFDTLSDEALWVIDAVREAGFPLEIDDFGTGHASVTALSRLRPDGMKIDKALVLPAPDDGESLSLLQSVVAIGKAFGMHIVAEGVEAQKHVALLGSLGVDALQGFHFGEATDAATLEAQLSSQTAAQAPTATDWGSGRRPT